MKNKKEKRTMLFLLVILAITVGYALLSQQLNIKGTAKIDKTTWKIIWNNVQVTNGSVTGDQVVQEPTIDTNKTTVEYSINLKQPKEFYEFTIDAKNEGTIDGMINVISNKIYESDGVTEVNPTPAYLNYKVTYSDGGELAQKHLLKSGTTETYKVRIEFKDVEASQLPSSSDRTLKFKFSVDYIQADDTGEEVVHGLTGTKYRTLPYKAVYIGDNVSEGVTLFDSVSDAKAAFNNKPFYLKHEIENDIVKESNVCFEKDGNTYCLRGGINESSLSEKPIYESNKTILKNAFGESNCTQNSSNLSCSAGGLNAYAYEIGYVYASYDSANCGVYDSGNSYCIG